MKIDITGVDLVSVAKAVYRHSQPQGLGILHFTEGELSDEDARACVGADGGLDMDYVHGRACKLYTVHKGGRTSIHVPWFDHTDEQLDALLKDIGVEGVTSKEEEHGVSCNCVECQPQGTQADPLQVFGQPERGGQ